MLFKYETFFALVAICYSGVAARPGPLDFRAIFNTTVSSSSTSSTSLSSPRTTPSFRSVSSSSNTVTTSPASYSSSVTFGSSTSKQVLITTRLIPDTTSSKDISTTSQTSSSPATSPLVISSSAESPLLTTSASTSFSVTSGTNSTTTLRLSTPTNATMTSKRSSSTTKSSHSLVTSHTTSITHRNTTSTAHRKSTSTTHTKCHPVTTKDLAGSVCISYCAVTTYFAYAPNVTETVTQTVLLQHNLTLLYKSSDFTTSQGLPPQPCTHIAPYQSSAIQTYTPSGIYTLPAISSDRSKPSSTILYVTSKTTITSTISSQIPDFVGNSIHDKSTALPTVNRPISNTQSASSQPMPPQSLVQPSTSTLSLQEIGPAALPTTLGKPNGFQQSIQTPQTPSTPTTDVNSVPVVLPGNTIIIGGTTLKPDSGTTILTANGKVYTVNPTQVIGPGTTIARPVQTPKGNLVASPMPTVISGVTIVVGPSIAVVGPSTYNIGPGTSPTTAVINGQTISIGPSGVQIGSTTLTPRPGIFPGATPTPPPTTHITTINGIPLTQIGSSIVVLGTQTFTLSALPSTPTTETLNGGKATVSIGPSGIAIIGGGASPGTTIPPIMPTPAPQNTKAITVDGITFSELGSSRVVIGSHTFTVGQGASPTTVVESVADGSSVTVSVGPGGVAVAGAGGTTTFAVGGTSAGVAKGTGTTTGTAGGGAGPSSTDGAASGGRRTSGCSTGGGVVIAVAGLMGLWLAVS